MGRNGPCLTTPSLSLTPGLPRTSPLRVRTSSLWRRWNPPLESSRTSSRRRRSWLRVCNLRPSKIQFNQIGIQSNRSECCLRPNNLNLSHTSSSPKYLCCTICIEIILRLKELIFANYLKTHISVLFLVLAFVWPVCVFLCSRKF